MERHFQPPLPTKTNGAATLFLHSAVCSSSSGLAGIIIDRSRKEGMLSPFWLRAMDRKVWKRRERTLEGLWSEKEAFLSVPSPSMSRTPSERRKERQKNLSVPVKKVKKKLALIFLFCQTETVVQCYPIRRGRKRPFCRGLKFLLLDSRREERRKVWPSKSGLTRPPNKSYNVTTSQPEPSLPTSRLAAMIVADGHKYPEGLRAVVLSSTFTPYGHLLLLCSPSLSRLPGRAMNGIRSVRTCVCNAYPNNVGGYVYAYKRGVISRE